MRLQRTARTQRVIDAVVNIAGLICLLVGLWVLAVIVDQVFS